MSRTASIRQSRIEKLRTMGSIISVRQGLHSIDFDLPIVHPSRPSNLNRIISEINDKEGFHEFLDWKDVSRDPSYTHFQIPYFLQCLNRHRANQELYDETFRTLIHKLIEAQPTAFEAFLFLRHMSITTLWPPMHTRKELENTQNAFFRLSKKKRERLDYLMNNKIM